MFLKRSINDEEENVKFLPQQMGTRNSFKKVQVLKKWPVGIATTKNALEVLSKMIQYENHGHWEKE